MLIVDPKGFLFLSTDGKDKGVTNSKSFCLWLAWDVGQKKAQVDWTVTAHHECT